MGSIQHNTADRYWNPNGETDVQSPQWTSYFENPVSFLLILTIITLVGQRLVSSARSHATPVLGQEGVRTVPAAPYWLPYLGHIPNYIFQGPETFLRKLKSTYSNHGIFSITLAGHIWNIVWDPEHTARVLGERESMVSNEEITDQMMQSVFGLPEFDLKKYQAALPEFVAAYKHILGQPGLRNLTADTTQRLREHIKDFVTGNESQVDQMPWEKVGEASTTIDKNGCSVVVAKLLPLIKDFVAYSVIPSLMGTDFLNNNPDFLSELWKFDAGFLLLATGLPRWAPIPVLTTAHIARKKCLEMLETFHEAMEKEANGDDPGPKWRGLEDVGALVKARLVIYRKHELSIQSRAAVELSLMWASSANSNPMVFWLVERLFADRALLEMVREEIAPYVAATQPQSDFALPEPPRFNSFDVEGLIDNCPLLKSCYVECMRLDSVITNLRVLKQDIVLRSPDKESEGWLLRKGEIVQATQDLHHTDENYFNDPMVWKADRHIKPEGDDKRRVAELGTVRPFGGGASMCKGRGFALNKIMMYTAAIISMFEIESPTGGPVIRASQKRAAGTNTSGDSTRVLIKRRVLGPKAKEIAG
ncbi:putative P450 monooxygenase [Teratosphaeria nubilosa]|uniref:Putative P450 monooxygenase n=1 Tax=Teratosphaeria nubilosa TaxID=161662 RepID=A0A6G1L1F5_9PEZI|nr:putative P450 monooxygenase [Teratosphaeria nubilosa]